MTFVPHAEIDTRAADQRWKLRYPSHVEGQEGQSVQEGDVVDFGFDAGDEDWYGDVVGFRGVRVLVDTHLNEIKAFDTGELRLVARKGDVENHPPAVEPAT